MMHAWGITDIGLVRKENQDAYMIHEAPDRTICVVCDGMGGSAGGQLASQIATRTFMEEAEKVLTPEMEPEQLRSACAYAVSLANNAIRSAAEENEDYRNMGTTLVAAVSYADGVVVTNVETAGPTISAKTASLALPRTTLWWSAWWTWAISPPRRPVAIPTATSLPGRWVRMPTLSAMFTSVL